MIEQTPIDEEMVALRPADNPAWATSPRGKAVMTQAMSSTVVADDPWPSTTRRGLRRWAPRTLAIGGLLAGTVAVATAAAVITAASPDDPTRAGCYSSLSAAADMTEAVPDLVRQVGPEDACRRTWQSIGESVDTTNLVLCITTSGGRGVFPAAAGMTPAEACGQIGQQPEVSQKRLRSD